ncbi:MAG: glutamate synthase, partial [Phycisphaerae bacterium]
MAELIPAPFADLVMRLFEEPKRQDALFELPRKRWHAASMEHPDTTVRFHGRPAGNPVGPAAGPHTQMAQNLLLSYVAGARILELKTDQIDDRQAIPRPCIDMTNDGYNVEWSQELLVADSLREYAAGAMLIEMFRHHAEWGGPGLLGPAGAVIYDISVGYDLAGIRSDKVRGFLDGMRDAGPVIERLRAEIPAPYAAAQRLEYPTCLSETVTLSTFHGCPADEIEKICEFLISEHDFDVIVKMNPPMLGKEKLEHLLRDVLGYTEITVNPKAYETGLAFDEGVQLCRRLTAFAARRGRSIGCKFSNTLEVINHREFFTTGNEIMYLSGQPLHVITMTLTDEFRRAVGPDVPISFSAGIDRQNFPLAVACGFVPITTSTDLLRPGGYGRLPGYLQQLVSEMRKAGATNVEEFIQRRFGNEAAARSRMEERGTRSGEQAQPIQNPKSTIQNQLVRWAGLLNTAAAAELAREDPRYRAAANRKIPKRIDSHLETFDCITCDKCLPV